MTAKLLFLATALVAITACAETGTTAAETGAVSNEQAFLDRLVGRALVNDDGNVTYAADGTLKGTSRGEALTGRWQFQNDRYCVVGRVGDRVFPAECQKVVYDGDRVTFDGKDFDVTYDIQG